MNSFKSAIAVTASVLTCSLCQAAENNVYGPDYGVFAGLECVESPYDKDIDKNLKDAQEKQARTNFIQTHGIMKTLDIYDVIETLVNINDGQRQQ